MAGDEAFAKIRGTLHKLARRGRQAILTPSVIAEREAFQIKHKTRSDTELLDLLYPEPAKSEMTSSQAQVISSGELSQPKIDVHIAYEPGGQIGADYNRIMRESPHEWILFLDHDVLLLHPSWYEVCQAAIKDHPNAGLLTCYTNNIACKHQKLCDSPEGHDISLHRARARALWRSSGNRCTENSRHLIGGFFMLTSKTA